jgi:D-serine deaminase-like pyridoxal phosphate-dependent protein
MLVTATMSQLDQLKHDVIGSPIEDLDTPALLLNWPASQRNIQKMAAYFKGKSCQLRPHFKNHKCVTLARHQQQAGSVVGFTCAKLGEAQVLADAGFDNILIANQVVGRRKVARLVELARRVQLAVAVDHVSQAAAISAAAQAAGVTVGVLIEVDIGMSRCGVKPCQPALELAQEIAMLPGIRFGGIQAFEGHLVYINDAAQRAELTRLSFEQAFDTKRLMEEHGIAVPVISGGATATYNIVGADRRMGEIQAGTYATMDWRYQEVTPEFELALSVLARVISRREGEAVIDVGVKGAGGEFGLPRVKGAPDVVIPFFLAEEHCRIQKPPAWSVGDAVHLLPSHACTTCNLHDYFFVHENGRVIDVWPIEAAGKLQ